MADNNSWARTSPWAVECRGLPVPPQTSAPCSPPTTWWPASEAVLLAVPARGTQHRGPTTTTLWPVRCWREITRSQISATNQDQSRIRLSHTGDTPVGWRDANSCSRRSNLSDKNLLRSWTSSIAASRPTTSCLRNPATCHRHTQTTRRATTVAIDTAGCTVGWTGR